MLSENHVHFDVASTDVPGTWYVIGTDKLIDLAGNVHTGIHPNADPLCLTVISL